MGKLDWLDKDKIKALKTAHGTYRDELVEVDKQHFPPAAKVPPPFVGAPETYGFPHLLPPPGTRDTEAFKRTDCIGAGIQY